MKGFSNKVLGTITRNKKNGADGSSTQQTDVTSGSPEVIAAQCVRKFCQSGGPNSSDDEVTLLPPIVDAAESSPAAAAECARLIRKYLHRDYWTKPAYQYNAIMLVRILSDNPGPTFTRNMDKKFVDVTRDLLAKGGDPSVRQILMETLDAFENTKGYDEGLGPIIAMWRKEKEKAYKAYGNRPPPGPRSLTAPPFDHTAAIHNQQNYFSRAHTNKPTLPPPVELANRLEEARTSSKLLEQVVACTPPTEVLDNDLIREFADRCLSASRSIQGYMTATNPPPDNDTMESLIDTNEQLQQALNHHQRAVLSARKSLGLNERSETATPALSVQEEQQRRVGNSGGSAAPQVPARKPAAVASGSGSGSGNGKGKATADAWDVGGSRSNGASSSASASRSRHGDDDDDDGQDPFRDPKPEGSSSSWRNNGSSSAEQRLSFDPYHPGFSGGAAGGGGSSAAAGSSIPRLDTTGAASSSVRNGKAVATDPVSPVNDDDDAYHATPKGKRNEPIYRY